ncbi:MAG: hypothetical protein RLZZ622_18, partial [Planctomycetota bacterium]
PALSDIDAPDVLTACHTNAAFSQRVLDRYCQWQSDGKGG